MSRRQLRQGERRRRRGLGSLLTLALVLTMAVVGLNAQPAMAQNPFEPDVELTSVNPVRIEDDEVLRGDILAGQDAVYQLSVSNTGGGDQFNTSVTASVPNGVSFTEADPLLGTPTIYESGDELPDSAGDGGTVPEGSQLWVWENIADLPEGATVDPTFTVRPDAGEFPVGGDLDIEVNAYTSNDENLLPSFPGSSGVAEDREHTSVPGDATENTPVEALRIHKSEPSPENELLRGVHNNSTTYTLRVQYTGEGTTTPVTVTDYLPAGLEYLGGGGIDNTQDSDNLYEGNNEYPGSGGLGGTPDPDGGDHREEDSVETVDLSDAQASDLGLGEGAGGVYTQVTWTLPELSGGTAQDWDEAAGEPGEYIIRYRAAVPLFENTMDFDVETPTAESGEQAANLNNNNGPSTRHGSADQHIDANSYTNVAHVQGTYHGDVADGDEVRTDHSTEVIDAVDLHIVKDVDTDLFVAGGLATYSLDLATSEYTSAESIVVTDELENGLCPVIPEQDADIEFQIGSATDYEPVDAENWPGVDVATECAYPSDEDDATLSRATLTALRFDPATGNFGLTLEVDDMDAQETHEVTYTARQNPAYIPAGGLSGPTVSGDAVGNTVEVQANTQPIDALEDVDDVGGQYFVWEDSEAVIESAFTEISKHVLERGAGTPPDVAAADWVDSAEETFIAGDEVWYRLQVNFPSTIDTRNPMVTDFFPQGVELSDVGDIMYYVNGEENEAFVDLDVNGSSLRWELGEETDGNRFVSAGTVLDIYLPGTVTGLAAAGAVDMPQNLMKYQQENTAGEIFFLRDDAEIELDYGMTLLKGVAEVDGDTGRPAESEQDEDGSEFGSDRDGIEVVQGETVTYRLDVTTPPFPTTEITVWDVLPDGITADDVEDAEDAYTLTIDGEESDAFDVTVVTPGGEGYPAVGDEFDERDVIVWTITADLEAEVPVTLTYDITIPEDTLVETELENVAGIASYEAETNQPGDETVTYVPDGPFANEPGDDEFGVPGEDTFDDSWVFLPGPEMSKSFESSEIAPPGTDPETDPTDPSNAVDQIVQGEYATFTYEVTLPGDTTVQGGVLADTGEFAFDGTIFDYQFVEGMAEVEYPAEDFDDTGFEFDEADGTLTFPEPSYTTGEEDETFAVTITVWVGEVENLSHGTDLENTATFTYTPAVGDPTTVQDTAEVEYIDPDLQITKSADPDTDLRIGDDVTYTLEVTNPGDQPISYDNTVEDTVPQGLEISEDSISDDGILIASDPDLGGGTIEWFIDEIPGGETVELTYQASILPAAGGAQTFTNEVDITGYTLPDTPDTDRSKRRGERTDDDDATVTTTDAGIDKLVRATQPEGEEFASNAQVPVGATVEYQVEVTLEPQINYWAPSITDTMPAGLQIDTGSIEGPTETSGTGTIDDVWAFAQDEDVISWTYDGDITSHTDERTLLITYEAVVTDAVTEDDLENTADFTWTQVEDGDTREGVEDAATVTLLHPELQIAKAVNGQPSDAVELGEVFDYELTVTNTGDTAGYNLVVTDVVPSGVVVDEDTISNGGVLEGADPVTGGGTITWDHDADESDALNGPLYHAESGDEPQEIPLPYQATLAASSELGADDEFVNTTRVTEWESFDDDGRSYGPSEEAEAEVTTAFPYLELNKAPTGSEIAYAGEEFSWTLTATNTGDGAAYLVELTDTLPANWTYDETVNVTVAGSEVDDGEYGFTSEGSGAGDERQVLAWTVDGSGEPVLEPGEEFLVTFTAIPSEDALDEAGVTEPDGTAVPHTNTLTARAEDPTGEDENADGPYSDPEDPASAYIHAADLVLTKTAVSEPIVAGSENVVGWTIEVTNDGPDEAVGPFVVADTTGELPEGLTIAGVSGDGWTGAFPERGENGVTTFEVTRDDAEETLPVGASFPAIEVLVSVAPDVAPTEVDNTAVVTSDGTHDPDPGNNEEEDPLQTTALADLAIEKVVNTEEPNAGAPITWQLNPSNLGPSVSQSTDENPITITDQVPEGIQGVTVQAGDDWTAEHDGEGDFPASAGDTITFTYTGDAMPLGPAGSITMTGTIDSSWPADTEIANTAHIHEGDTDDPEPDSNTSTVPVTPETNTSLGITKTRVDVDTDPVPGEPVSYGVIVANNGPADAQNVTVVDELPEYFTFVDIENVEGAWQRTGGGETGTQNFALTNPEALAPGDAASFIITVDLDSDHTGDVVNWVQADADNSTNTPEDEDDSSSDRQANLSIVKEHGLDEVVAGETVDYTITVTNEGPSTSSAPITVTDRLPAGFTYVEGSATQSDPDVDETGRNLTWTFDQDLAANGTIEITFTAAVAADVAAQTGLVNAVTVDGPEDTDPTDNYDEDPTNVITEAEMSIVKDVEDGPWVAGEEVTYTFTVTNDGPSVADASVRDIWPTGLTGVSIAGEGWDCENGTCEFDGHPVDTSTLTVTGLIDQALQPETELVNTAALRWTDSRGSHDDEDPETIVVDTEADLELAKTAVDADGIDITEAVAGEQARYLLQVTNHGPSQAAAPITVTDELPEGVSFVGLGGESGTYWDVDEVEGQNLTFTLGDGEVSLPSGASAPDLTLIVHLDAGLPTTDEPDVPALVNSAVVSSPTYDPDPDNNDDEAPLNVEQAADLAITKFHQGTAAIGEDLSFDVVVTNLGPSEATGVIVTDTIPAGLDYVGYDGSDEAWSQVDEPVNNDDGTTTVTFALEGTLDVEEQAPPLVVTTSVTADAYPEVTNVVVVDGDQPDRNPDNNEDPDLVTVPPLANLGIDKMLDGDGLTVGEQASYTLTVTNYGPTEHVGEIVITDELPAGLVATDVEGLNCGIVEDGAWVECLTDETLAVDDTLTLTITVDVLATAWSEQDPEVTNTATVSGTSEDPEEENNTSTVTTPVTPYVALELEKTRSSTDGDSVDWDITVTSVGLNDAVDGVVVVDELPDELRFDGVTSEADVPCSTDAQNVVECEVPGPIAAGDSVTITLHTTLLVEDTEVTNVAWLLDPETGEVTPDSTDSADYRPGVLSVTGAGVGAIVALALLLLLGGGFLAHRARRA